jgi:hypothetical protein
MQRSAVGAAQQGQVRTAEWAETARPPAHRASVEARTAVLVLAGREAQRDQVATAPPAGLVVPAALVATAAPRTVDLLTIAGLALSQETSRATVYPAVSEALAALRGPDLRAALAPQAWPEREGVPGTTAGLPAAMDRPEDPEVWAVSEAKGASRERLETAAPVARAVLVSAAQ